MLIMSRIEDGVGHGFRDDPALRKSGLKQMQP